jgi:hypothetical protein
MPFFDGRQRPDHLPAGKSRAFEGNAMKRERISSLRYREMRSRKSVRYAGICKAVLGARKHFGGMFGLDVGKDPVGDMLLDLYLREEEGRSTSISCLWGAASVASTTARRSVNKLESRKIIVRTPDPADGRRFLVRLTRKARAAIEAGLDMIVASVPSVERDRY